MAKNTLSVGTHAENPQGNKAPAPEVKAAEKPATEEKAPDAPVVETPAVEEKAPEAPVVETPAVEEKAPEAPVTETPAPEVKAPEAPKAGAKPKSKLSEAVIKRAKEVFMHHPTVDTIYFTSDDTAFLGTQYARMHAESLKDSVVTPVTRKEIA